MIPQMDVRVSQAYKPHTWESHHLIKPNAHILGHLQVVAHLNPVD